MKKERRRRRSNFVGLALQYLLSSMARQRKLFGMVLADEAGLVVASSKDCPDAEEMAAIAPLMESSIACTVATPLTEETALSIHRLRVEQTKLYICAMGHHERSKRGAEGAASAVQLILASYC